MTRIDSDVSEITEMATKKDTIGTTILVPVIDLLQITSTRARRHRSEVGRYISEMYTMRVKVSARKCWNCDI
jgi:hypothetical protein